MSMKTSLPTVPFGKTGMNITRVGFGSWAIGGGDWAVGWGDQEDKDSIQAIQHAVSCGVNWIDTAAIYGLGRSEEVVAAAMRDIPKSERPFIFTKCGLIGDKANPNELPKRVGAPASIRREVEGSLQRLEVEQIDLYQMHWPANDGTPVEEYWQVLLDLKKEGKIRAAGLSNHNVEQLTAAEKLGHVDTLQPPFSAIKREVGDKELAWCHQHNTGVIVYSPMQAGLLTGAFSRERVAALPKNDWRSRNAEFTENLDKNLAVAASMAKVAARHNVSTASVAVAWTLAWPGVTAAIVGARGPKQVDGWLAAASLALARDDMEEIGAVIASSGAGTGPVKPNK
ncbi:MAG TPA: aldo/keto reductase [Acidocella sp.]|uniref:aldo/keto reductase n=1 Tax=Acidocella sp. TaxID=50710 RepID=UPI002BEBAE95|nr:aldo/keto reductase [Acidocella sp.]HVE22153.1 aldo/keto reductase [Acidocella sp.]